MNSIDGVLGIEKLNESEDGILNIRLICKADADLREPIYNAIKKTDWALMEFHLKTKTLETIFRELTREN